MIPTFGFRRHFLQDREIAHEEQIEIVACVCGHIINPLDQAVSFKYFAHDNENALNLL